MANDPSIADRLLAFAVFKRLWLKQEKRRDIYIENARLSAFSRHFKRHEPSTAHQSINDPYAAKAIAKALFPLFIFSFRNECL